MSESAGAVLEVGPIEDGQAFLDRITPLMQPPHQWNFKPLFLDQLDAPGPEYSYLIDGWLSEADISIVGGPSQSGKSFLAIHAGMCVAHDIPFFGAAVSSGVVIYQAGEGVRGVKKRLRAWRKHHKIEFSRQTRFVLLQGKIDLYGHEDTPALIAEIKALALEFDVPLKLIVIDTLATATAGADEVSGRDMGTVLGNVARIRAETGVHVMLVHHMNAGGTKLRGHTSIYANVDQVVLVTSNSETKIRTARLDKQKDDESGLNFQFELMSVEIGADSREKPITSCVCLQVGEKAAIRREEEQKGFKLKTEEVNFMRAFFTADRRHGMPVPETLDTPSGVRTVVDYAEVKRAYGQATPDDDDELDAPKDGESEEDAAKRKTERDKKRSARLSKKLGIVRESLTKFGIIGFGQMAGDPRWFGWWTGKPLRDFPKTQPKRQDPEPEDLGGGEAPGQFEDIPW